MRIRRIYGCYDAGRVINPKLAHSQAIGGMVGGIGMALLKGTLVIVGVPAAIANAMFNATGKRVTDLPITCEQPL